MVRLATRRLQSEIGRGRAEVREAEAARLPFEDAHCDAALAVHVFHRGAAAPSASGRH